MIKNIQKIKGFGIFKDCTNTGVSDFGKYNLVFGWNGSGKSTLASLFRSLETKKVPVDFSNAEYSVLLKNNTSLNSDTLSNSELNIHVFNQSFVNENIDWDNSVKSILLVSKEKIDERKKLGDLKSKREEDSVTFDEENGAISDLNKELSGFMTKSAKRMKAGLRTIDTSDSYYFNYDKRKLEAFITENEAEVKQGSALLSDSDIITLTNSAKPDKKIKINISIPRLNVSTFDKAKVRLDDLLKTTAVNKVIERLAKFGDLQKWVSGGLDLHKKHESSACEFCGNIISDERITDIEAHFNDAYKHFKDRLNSADSWLNDQYVKEAYLPPETELYDEFKTEYAVLCAALNKASSNVNDDINKWHQALKDKIDNPFDTSIDIESISTSLIDEFNGALQAVLGVITKHNSKTDNFERETNKSKKRLELHYAASEIKDFNYFGKKKDAVERTDKNKKLKTNLDGQKVIIQKIEDSLSNEGIGADQFNDSLHKFIGRSELTLRFDKNILGYEIIRNNSGSHVVNLSEGEKTAIAFVYFITKLTENDNKIDKTIVVVDDPVSSFDSNHLFHAYSFLKCECKDALQLFVLTHNFTYFRLMRDWFYKGNVNRARKSKDKNAFFYTVEASVTSPRESKLINANASLTDYNSEYHYIFYKLYEFKNSSSLDRDQAFLTANLSRKLLESFFSFKFPKNRSDISQLMDCGLKGCSLTTIEIKEKIYRFINKYSHSAVIEINEDASENLMGESYSVIADIFKWIEEVDEVHYSEMVESIEN
ncbi:MAG: AAA family ATPase [Woeseiaceae bacterium]